MKNSLLLSNRYKVIGWLVFFSFAILGLAYMYLDFKIPGFQLYYPSNKGIFDIEGYNLTDELALTGITVGLLMVCFAKEKTEDEYILQLRLKSWQWSIFVSYMIFIIMAFTFYGFAFFGVLIHNVFTVLVVFIIKFNFSLYQLRREGSIDEK